MDGLGAGDFSRRDNGRDVEIALGRGRRAHTDAFVCQADMHRIGVGLGVDGDGAYAHLAAGAVDTKGDFAAIGDQDLVEHSGRSRVKG